MRKLFGTSREAGTPTLSTMELGAFGERLARDELKRRGYRIVAMNYTAPLGRSHNGRPITGEIDLIAYDPDGVLCFIEVKTRSSAVFAMPEAAVDLPKQRQIIRTSRIYRRVLQLSGEPYRYDVVSVLMTSREPEITLLQNYFSEARFERSGWFRGY